MKPVSIESPVSQPSEGVVHAADWAETTVAQWDGRLPGHVVSVGFVGKRDWSPAEGVVLARQIDGTGSVLVIGLRHSEDPDAVVADAIARGADDVAVLTQVTDDAGRSVARVVAADRHEEWLMCGEMVDGEVVEWTIQAHQQIQPAIVNNTLRRKPDLLMTLPEFGQHLRDTFIGYGCRNETDLDLLVSTAMERILGDPTTMSVQADPDVQRTHTRRNAACPCGSGKKYKKCCLIRAN